MNLMEAAQSRHSVRQYLEKPIEGETLAALQEEIADINREAGLHFQLVANEPRAFDCAMAHYGKFSGVTSYVALVGPKGSTLGEKCGYYGERLALRAQQMGLNTCWVAMSYKRIPDAFRVEPGEKLTVVLAIGYGAVQGTAHRSKAAADVSNAGSGTPEWFCSGVACALLAPTAMNQQKFTLTWTQEGVRAQAGMGFYTKLDLGIVKYHFELGAGGAPFRWL